MRFLKSLILALTVLPVSLFAAYADTKPAKDTAYFLGEVTTHKSNDTLYVKYHLTLRNCAADSIRFCVRKDDTISFYTAGEQDSTRRALLFNRLEGIPFINDWRSVSKKHGHEYYDGQIFIPLHGRSYDLWRFIAFAYLGSDSIPKAALFEYVNSSYLGISGGFWLPNFGYYSTRDEKNTRATGAVFGMDAGLEYGSEHIRYVLETSWSGFGKNLKFSEPVFLRTQYFIGKRNQFAFGPFASVKLSKIKYHSSERQFSKTGFGLDCGASLQGAFERLSYSYSSSAGGYHTVDLFLAGSSGGTGTRLGTLYTFRLQNGVWMVQMGMHLEGWDYENEPMERENRRNILHKGLAYGGILPILPFHGIELLGKALFGKSKK